MTIISDKKKAVAQELESRELPPALRPERLRRMPGMRNLVQENRLHPSELVLPLFINSDKKGKKEISSMPDVYQWSLNELVKFLEKHIEMGLRSFMLFGVIPAQDKTAKGERAIDPKGPVVQALTTLRKEFGYDINLFADACFCEYTNHGHCGVFESKQGQWLRDSSETLAQLAQEAVIYAQAGASVIAPSGTLDGMVATIRDALDLNGYSDTGICSYAVKYSSAFYGPFREAAQNAPKAGTDRKAYQMDPANRKEALREIELDIAEGADLLLVKPALSYLDIVRDVADRSLLPVGAYQVSGEYSMIKAAAQNGWIHEDAAFAESLVSMKRAGAKFILSYWAPRAAELMKKGAL